MIKNVTFLINLKKIALSKEIIQVLYTAQYTT